MELSIRHVNSYLLERQCTCLLGVQEENLQNVGSRFEHCGQDVGEMGTGTVTKTKI